MPGRDCPAARGARRSRLLRTRLAEELANAKEGAGISTRVLARQVGVSPDTIARLLRGDAGAMSIDLTARTSEVLGLQLAASVHPVADPVRDRAHLSLLSRFRSRIATALAWRTEVPVPIGRDLRSGDAMLGDVDWDGLVEAETYLGDLQAIERRARSKARDLGADRLILLVADTRHNREVIRLHPELRERFPIDTRTCLAKLARGEDPGGDCLVIL
jgi:transcriptional regulator with XRE-family HTH domain